MTSKEIKSVVFLVLNPRGKAIKKGQWYPDGGNYNGYVAIPKKFESLFEYDYDWQEYNNMPSVHGGCTYSNNLFTIENFRKWEGTTIIKGDFVDSEEYFVVGFDTLHCDDTEERWPMEAIAKEAIEWDEAIRTKLSELVDTRAEQSKLAVLDHLHSTNINKFFNSLPKWPIEEAIGYKPCTTFWQDFSIADMFVLNGTEPDGVQDTHNRTWPALKDGIMDIKYLTEYAMVLNWKIHQHYGQHDLLAELYDRLWREVDGWCMENLKGEDLSYYISTTD